MRKNKITWALVALMALAFIATIRALFVYELPNKIFYIAVFAAAICNLFTVPCLIMVIGTLTWNILLIYLVGWPLAILSVVCYWYLFKNRKKPEQISVEIRHDNGLIFQCMLRTCIGIPIPWKRLQIRRTGGVLKIFQTNLFARKNYAQKIASLCDPELEGGFFPYMLFGTSILFLKEHTSKEDKPWMKFTLSNSHARFLAGEKDDEGFFDQLIRQARSENDGGVYIN